MELHENGNHDIQREHCMHLC